MKHRGVCAGPAALIAALLFLSSCGGPAANTGEQPAKVNQLTPEEAKKALYDKGIHYSQKTFYQTVVRNDIDTVKLFFAAGMDVNARGEFGETALSSAAASPDHLAMARLLLDKGADVNISADIGDSPLAIALHGNNLELVKILLAKGADPNRASKSSYTPGTTPLMMAARAGNMEIVKLLLAHNADVSQRDAHGESAVDYAAQAGQQAIVDFLGSAASTPGGEGSS